MSEQSSNYVVVQNGIDAPRAAMEPASDDFGKEGVADENGAQTLDDDDFEGLRISVLLAKREGVCGSFSLSKLLF